MAEDATSVTGSKQQQRRQQQQQQQEKQSLDSDKSQKQSKPRPSTVSPAENYAKEVLKRSVAKARYSLYSLYRLIDLI